MNLLSIFKLLFAALITIFEAVVVLQKGVRHEAVN